MLVVLAILAAVRRPGDSVGHQAVTWMSLLVLAALQSPFAPAYTLIALLWALTLLVVEVETVRGGIALMLLLWLGLVVVVPWSDLSLFAAHSIVQSVLAVGVPIWLIFRAAPRSVSGT